MRWRILSAVVGWPALGFAVVYLPERAFGLLAAIAIAVAYLEYLKLLVFARNRVTGWIAFAGGLVCLFLFWANLLEALLAVLIINALILLAVPVLTRGSLAENLLASALALTGLVYVVIPLGFVITIRHLPRGIHLVGFLFMVTWARDLGAFLIGRIGRKAQSQKAHFINRSISPHKTYEGTVGGVVAASLVAVLTRNWLGESVPLTYALLLGILAGIFGQVGDLVESLMKRVSEVSDSSNLIPGQGGLFDTLDSFIYTAPLLYLFITLKELMLI